MTPEQKNDYIRLLSNERDELRKRNNQIKFDNQSEYEKEIRNSILWKLCRELSIIELSNKSKKPEFLSKVVNLLSEYTHPGIPDMDDFVKKVYDFIPKENVKL